MYEYIHHAPTELIALADAAVEYARLVEKIYEVDQDAAQALRNVAATGAGNFRFTGSVETAFYWANTNQGNKYWNKVRHIPLAEVGVSDDVVTEYYEMVKEIAKFDLIAAKKLIMVPFVVDDVSYGDTISGAFRWEDTEEGLGYWAALNVQLHDWRKR